MRLRHASSSAAIGALVRGEVSLVEHVPADRVASLAADPEIKVGRFTRPTCTASRSMAGPSRSATGPSVAASPTRSTARRSWKRPSCDAPPTRPTSVADGPFPKGSYADAPDVKPLGYDPLLAKMLIAAARKELGGAAIKLTLDYPATPEAQAVVPKIVERFGSWGWRSSRSSAPRRNWKRNCEPGVDSTWRTSLRRASSPRWMPAR